MSKINNFIIIILICLIIYLLNNKCFNYYTYKEFMSNNNSNKTTISAGITDFQYPLPSYETLNNVNLPKIEYCNSDNCSSINNNCYKIYNNIIM